MKRVKAEVLNFPAPKRAKSKAPKSNGELKYFNESQIKLLRRTLKDADTLARSKGTITPIREWAVIDTLTSSGIRVSECANLRVGDLKAAYGEPPSLYIRGGKGSKSRTVEIPAALRKHLKGFIRWKKERGEPVGKTDFLFLGQRGPLTAAGIQQIVKGHLRQLGLYEPGKSAHSLRHSYAVGLYRQKKDLRCVQKQLGHSSVQTTTVYADVTREDIQEQIQGMWQ